MRNKESAKQWTREFFEEPLVSQCLEAEKTARRTKNNGKTGKTRKKEQTGKIKIGKEKQENREK